MNPNRRSVEFIFFDAGGGHRSAATALQKVIPETYPDWDVTLVNLQELLKPLDPFHRLLNVESQDIYNKALKNGFTFAGGAILTSLQAGIRYYAPRIEELLRAHWQLSAPDLVVSFIPNFNAALFRALRDEQPDTPYVTIMTDIADCPPHFWQEPQDQWIVCGSDMAVHQARVAGYPDARIRRTSGMILKPDFYRPVTVDRSVARQAIGLDPGKPTALIMFGGNGSRQAARIVARLRKANLGVQSIVMCGSNESLRETLSDLPHCHAVGFTDKVADYMALADFFIGKAGPGSISEALHMGLPVIIENGVRTMPQERYNAVWVEENGFGLSISSFRQIAAAVAHILEGDRLAQLRHNAASLDNRAVYEIPAMLAELMPARIDAVATARGATNLGSRV